MLDNAIAKISQNAHQRFLANILQRFPGAHSNTGFDANQIAEVTGKVFFGWAVTILQPLDIVCVE
jgi:hypothetical protein